jgi:hypothetical protein
MTKLLNDGVRHLNMRPVQVFEVDYGDLELFITDSFDLKSQFSIPADQESGNDTTISLNVDPRLGEYSRQRVAAYVASESSVFVLGDMMDYLCAYGRISPGKYIINISW